MNRLTLPRIRVRDVVVLVALAAGFAAQAPADRFGYLMGLAWLAIVFGCYDVWVSIDPERVAEAERQRSAWRDMAHRLDERRHVDLEARLELDTTAYDEALAQLRASDLPPALSFSEALRAEILARGQWPVLCVCDRADCWCASWVGRDPAIGLSPATATSTAFANVACDQCRDGHHVLTMGGPRS